jgi:hypothetical protein
MLPLHLTAPLLPRPASLPKAGFARLQEQTTQQLAPPPPESDSRQPRPTSRPGSPEHEQRQRPRGCTAPPNRSPDRSPREREQFAQPRDASGRQWQSRRRLQYCGSCGVEFYNEVRPHSALRGRTPASITLPSCWPASRPLRAGFAGDLRPGLTQAARDGADEGGRDGETPLDRTKKHRHDGRDGNPGLYF